MRAQVAAHEPRYPARAGPTCGPGAIMTSTGIITIDLSALASNWRSLAARVAPAECGAVVKADAYGLGAAHVIPALVDVGCRTFFIATPGEGLEARRHAPEARIFALDGLVAGCGDQLLAANVLPVLSSLPEIREWAALARARRSGPEATRAAAPLSCAIHVDSGLNRLGLSAADLRALGQEPDLLRDLHVALVMSHLACADDPAEPLNDQQRATFDARRALLPPAPASLAASDGLMLGPAFHYDLVRPGYALYGGQAFKGGETPVKPVVRVAARVLQVREVGPGDAVGYSATWRTSRASRIAVIAAGYADGFLRSGSNPGAHAGAKVSFRGATAPVVGRVSMDLITVDITDLDPWPERGDLVDIVGPGLTIESMGARAGTIGYEVLTALSRRLSRTYLER